jgi:hypothetical protein
LGPNKFSLYFLIKPNQDRYGGTHLKSQLLGRWRQKDHKFKASWEKVVVRPCLKNRNKRPGVGLKW